MTELTNALYEFVTRRYLPGICIDPEYEKALEYAGIKRAQLDSQLEEGQRRLLAELLDEVSLAHCHEREQIFQAALALSRELSGLVR